MLRLQMVKLIAQRFDAGGKSTTGEGVPTSGASLCKRASVQTLSRLLSARMVFAYLLQRANAIITVTNDHFLCLFCLGSYTVGRRNNHPSNSTPASDGSPADHPHISHSCKKNNNRNQSDLTTTCVNEECITERLMTGHSSPSLCSIHPSLFAIFRGFFFSLCLSFRETKNRSSHSDREKGRPGPGLSPLERPDWSRPAVLSFVAVWTARQTAL